MQWYTCVIPDLTRLVWEDSEFRPSLVIQLDAVAKERGKNNKKPAHMVLSASPDLGGPGPAGELWVTY